MVFKSLLLYICCWIGFAEVSLEFVSQEGEYIGNGWDFSQSYLFENIEISYYPNNVIKIENNDSTPYWRFKFGSQDGERLEVGAYLQAQQSGDSHILDMAFDGNGCTNYGNFWVQEIEYDGNGNLTNFAVDFEAYCRCQSPGLFGSLRIQSNLEHESWELPSHDHIFEIYGQEGDYICGGQSYTIDNSNGLVDLCYYPPNYIDVSMRGPEFFYNLSISAPEDQTLSTGLYEPAHRFSDPILAGLAIGFQHNGCNSSFGWFQVLEIAIDSLGNVEQLAFDFEQHCEGATPGSFGSFNLNQGRKPRNGEYFQQACYLEFKTDNEHD